MTYKKFKISEELPKNFKEALVQRLPRHSFRDIDPHNNPEQSVGWVNAFDTADNQLNMEKILFGKYIILGMRKDKKSVPAAMLKLRLNAAVKAQMKERGGRRLSRPEVANLKEAVKEKLLAEMIATSTFFECVWNYETQEVYFSTQSGKTLIEFAELFEETFQLPLEEENLVSRAEAFIRDRGLSIELQDVEPARFGN